MTLDTRLMPNLTGAGNRRPPASMAAVECCCSSSHLLENGAGFVVACRELAKMLVQVLADLIFSSSDEAQADAIADQTGRGANPERQPVEKRIEHAGVAAQLADALFTPGQMVDFLIRRLFHRPTYLREASRQGLALVQRLSADFAGVVDAHQAGNVAGLALAEFGLVLQDRRRRACWLATERQQRAQGRISLHQQAVSWGVVALAGHMSSGTGWSHGQWMRLQFGRLAVSLAANASAADRVRACEYG